MLFLTPGPIVTLVVTTGARARRRAPALMTVAGATAGNAVLLACIAFGLSWILQNVGARSSTVLRWVGAAYLVWLGIQAWRHAGTPAEAIAAAAATCMPGAASSSPSPIRRSIAFFTAFLPQFIDPACRSGGNCW